jgi:hypothetical protein
MRGVRLLPACTVLAVLACSTESVPAPANLAGTWNFSYATASESGVTCHGAMTFTISQTDQTFVGFQRNTGSVSCTGVALALATPNPNSPTEFDNETINAGVVSPNEVAFQLSMLQSHDAGVVVKDGVMSGTTTWVLPIKPKGTITVTGTWTASKQ